MDYTQNLHLPQWEKTDRIHHDDFNDAMAAIDTAVAAAPRIATGSYTGTGEYGSTHPNTLTFAFAPKLVVVANPNSGFGRALFWPGTTTAHVQYDSVTDSVETIAWSNNGKTLQWYHYSRPEQQLNTNGYKYYYLAIG